LNLLNSFKNRGHCLLCKNKEGERINTYYPGNKIEENAFYFILCRDCNLMFLHSLPDKKDINLLYKKDYSGYSSLGFLTKFAQRFSAFLKNKKVYELLKFKKKIEAAEIGPGSNPMLRMSKKNFLSKIYYYDLQNVRNMYHENRNIKFVSVEDASKFPTRNKINLIVANQLIEHLLNPVSFLMNCFEALKADGILFMETPNFDSFEYRLFKHTGVWGGFHTPKHFYLFNKKSLINLVENNGFVVISHEYIMSPYVWSESFKQFFMKKRLSFLAHFFSIKNPLALLIYLFLDFLLLAFKIPTSNQRIIAIKGN
jgi:predicted SAM-dependent methyltransferase